jgi:hypothetical protein
MNYSSRRITVNFTNGKGFEEANAIKGIAAALKGIDIGCGMDFDRDGSNEYTCVGRPQENSWMVSFRPYGNDASRRKYYPTPEDAAIAIYRKTHQA